MQDTSLVSPVVDMSSLTDPVLGFKQDYNKLGDTADVDVSVDGGDHLGERPAPDDRRPRSA